MEKRKSKLLIGIDCAMLLATLLLLWASESLGGWGLFFVLFLPLPACILTWERRWIAYALTYLLVSAIILMLPFPHYVWFCYITVLGPYPLFRRFVLRLRPGRIGSILMLLLCNVLIGVGFAGLTLLGAHPLAETTPVGIILLVTTAEIVFLLLDVLYHLFHRLYLRRLRRFLFV